MLHHSWRISFFSDMGKMTYGLTRETKLPPMIHLWSLAAIARSLGVFDMNPKTTPKRNGTSEPPNVRAQNFCFYVPIFVIVRIFLGELRRYGELCYSVRLQDNTSLSMKIARSLGVFDMNPKTTPKRNGTRQRPGAVAVWLSLVMARYSATSLAV